MQQLSKALGLNIRTIRKSKGISQEGFALMCGVDRSYMGRIERGEVNITLEKLYCIAKALNLSPSELLPSLEQVDI